MRVGLVGCGLIGAKRLAALHPEDEVVGLVDVDVGRSSELAQRMGVKVASTVDALLRNGPEAVIVSTSHDSLAPTAANVLKAGVRVFVEKPAARISRELRELADLERSVGLPVGVGFNHRFNPAIRRMLEVVRSQEYGTVLAIRARYGHGARLGYDHEWRMDPWVSGGGEFIDQGSHLVDLSREIIGEVPVVSSLARTVYWDAPSDDSAVVVLGTPGEPRTPYSLLHVTCAEWKNTFEFEVWMRFGKVRVTGLQGSYGEPVLTTYAMRPELGPPDEHVETFPGEDLSWSREWAAFRDGKVGVAGGVGDLSAAAYVHEVADAVYGEQEWRVR